MLELRPVCEHCGIALPPETTEAMICSFERVNPSPVPDPHSFQNSSPSIRGKAKRAAPIIAKAQSRESGVAKR